MDTSTIILSPQDEVLRNLFPWELSPNGYVRYRINVKGTIVSLSLHRFVLGLILGRGYYQDVTFDVDHINHNKLDNSRPNLRQATRAQNNFNGHKKGNTSKYKGVHYSKPHGKWIANITIYYQNVYLGMWELEEEAAFAYNVAVYEASDGLCLRNSVTISPQRESYISTYVKAKIATALLNRKRMQVKHKLHV